MIKANVASLKNSTTPYLTIKNIQVYYVCNRQATVGEQN